MGLTILSILLLHQACGGMPLISRHTHLFMYHSASDHFLTFIICSLKFLASKDKTASIYSFDSKATMNTSFPTSRIIETPGQYYRNTFNMSSSFFGSFISMIKLISNHNVLLSHFFALIVLISGSHTFLGASV